ncbi:MAG: hypothetical protein ACREAY_06535 [Nitrososphaera sp.]|uniref:hypothetical protein n=1 Tax=Nitrososphaera sp. TaxID=1971748 RepID=UPI003D6DF7B6
MVAVSTRLLIQWANLSFQDSAPSPALTSMNVSLEPRQTQDLNHPLMAGQVMELRIEPNTGNEPIPEYELLVTLVDPSGGMVFTKFITEPYYQEFRPLYPGWHAIIITNVGETTVASGAWIKSRAFEVDDDQDVPFANHCNIPPSFEKGRDLSYPWC